MSRYLYRGYGVNVYASMEDALMPKAPGEFSHVFKRDGTITHDGSARHGLCAENAVLYHQLSHVESPTAGISTSPHKERALHYALGRGKNKEGVILTIDRDALSQHGVSEYVVAEGVASPSIPADAEVILVSVSGEQIPVGVVVARESVFA